MQNESLVPVQHQREDGQPALMEDALKTTPQMMSIYVQQFIGRWWITYTEMGVPDERRFQETQESLRAGRGPVYAKLREYAEEVARRYAKFPAGVVMRAWQLGVMNWRIDGHTYPVFDIGVLLGWLKQYTQQAVNDVYPDGWPGQKRLAAPSTAKALPQHEPTVEEQWENVCALKQMQPDLWKLYMAGGAGVDLWREISNRLLATNPRLHALTRARARKSFRRELGGLLTMPWQRFRGKSVEELQEQYGNRLGNNFPSRRHHWKMALFEIGHKVMEAADESV